MSATTTRSSTTRSRALATTRQRYRAEPSRWTRTRRSPTGPRSTPTAHRNRFGAEREGPVQAGPSYLPLIHAPTYNRHTLLALSPLRRPPYVDAVRLFQEADRASVRGQDRHHD